MGFLQGVYSMHLLLPLDYAVLIKHTHTLTNKQTNKRPVFKAVS